MTKVALDPCACGVHDGTMVLARNTRVTYPFQTAIPQLDTHGRKRDVAFVASVAADAHGVVHLAVNGNHRHGDARLTAVLGRVELQESTAENICERCEACVPEIHEAFVKAHWDVSQARGLHAAYNICSFVNKPDIQQATAEMLCVWEIMESRGKHHPRAHANAAMHQKKGIHPESF